MENNNQKIISFKEGEDPKDVIKKILEDNGLKEDLNSYLEKIKQNKEPFFDVLYKLAKKLATQETTETEFLSNIQQKLNVSEQIAKKILGETQQKFLVLVEIINNDDNEGYEPEIEKKSVNLTDQIKKPASSPLTDNTVSKIESDITIKKRVIKNNNETEPERIKNPVINKQPIKRKQNDTYREPIE